jgi:hypothetical protein
MHDKKTSEILFYYVFIIKNGKMTGIAEGNKPLEFKSRSAAKKFAINFINSEDSNLFRA